MTSRRGFTLVEVLVALTVSGLVVLVAARIFAAVGEAGTQLREARLALDRQANARRWLKAALLSLDVGHDSAGPFEGQADRAQFGTWLRTSAGWFAPRRVDLQLVGEAFVANLTTGAGEEPSRVILADSVSSVAFDYLLQPGEDTKWAREWISPVSAPLAVRIRIAHAKGVDRAGVGVDTLLLLIKGRG